MLQTSQIDSMADTQCPPENFVVPIASENATDVQDVSAENTNMQSITVLRRVQGIKDFTLNEFHELAFAVRVCLSLPITETEAIDHPPEIGTCFYSHTVTQNHKVQRILKLRTMPAGSHILQQKIADEVGVNGNGQIKNDPRVQSKFMAFLRATKLDESPQALQWFTGFVYGRFLGTKYLNVFGLRPQNEARKQLIPYREHYEPMREQVPYGLLSPTYMLPSGASKEEIRKIEQAYLRIYLLCGKLAAYKKFGPQIVHSLAKRCIDKLGNAVTVPLGTTLKRGDEAGEVGS